MTSFPFPGPTGLYIHFPFCLRTCFYCHFVKRHYDTEEVHRYVTTLIQEIKLRPTRGPTLSSIYIGGGSPSLLSESHLQEIMNTISCQFTLDPHLEFTLEMNPQEVTREKLIMLKQMGVNRLSIGTQSFVQTDLDYLQRTHNAEQSRAAVELALHTGFTNLNIDLIISLPTQSKQSLKKNISQLRQWPIPHISAYILEEVEEPEHSGNPELKLTRDQNLYFYTVEQLGTMGYNHYEVSNFCQRDFYAQHNLKYWRNQEYIGMGLSASGFEAGVEYKNTANMDTYYQSIHAGQWPREEFHHPDLALRQIVTGLRLLAGIPRHHFDAFPEPTQFLLKEGFLVEKKGRIAVPGEKMLLLNEILSYFF